MEQFDITEFARMFDAALASNNPSVQKALRNFMMVAAIVGSQDIDERNMGPLETLIKKVSDLERMYYDLKNKQDYTKSRDHWKDYYGTNPTWVYSPDVGPTSSGSTYATPQGQSTVSSIEMLKYLKDIKLT